MKKFKFNLDTILRYRGMIEDQEKNYLAKLNADMFQLTSELGQLKEYHRNEVADFERVSQKGIQVQEMLGRKVTINNIKYAIDEKLNEIKEQQKLINRQTTVVVKATQDKKIIEKLKEKSLKRYNKALLKADEQFIEEFVSYQTHIGKSNI